MWAITARFALLTALDVQAVLDNIVWKIIPNAWPISSRRSGWLQKNLPDNGPSCDVQNVGTEMPRVGNQNVDCDGGLHEGVRLHLSQFYLGGTLILQCRSWVRQPPEENFQRSEGVSTDRRREQHFRYPKRFQARWSDVQPAVEHCTAVLIKKRNTTMAKDERNGNLLERPRTRLPNEPAICRRRDVVRNLQRTDTEHDVRIQESNRESGTQDSPRQDENSQQPEKHEFRHKKIY